MFTIAFLITFIVGFFGEDETTLTVSGLFAIASAIEQIGWRYSKK